jgi:molybdopterin converting factor small subunit
LLFEKFVRHQLQNRLISMQKDAVQVDQVVAEKEAMQAQLVQQQTVQDELFARWREQQDRINALQEQNIKMHENHTRKLAGMQDQLNSVMEERDGLAEFVESQKEEVARLKKELATTEDKNFQLEATLSTTSQYGPSTASLEAQLKSMKRQLLLWEEHRKFVERERTQIEDMREKIHTQDTLLSQANRAHEQANTKAAYVPVHTF